MSRGRSERAVRPIAAIALLLLAATVLAGKPAFTTTWKSPQAAGVRFAGQKIAAMVITNDISLEMSAEEQLVRELGARGMQGVATYRMVPREELTNADRARPWFERGDVQGVVALRPVSMETVRTYAPSVWTTSSYSTLWGYYGYGWTGVYSPGGMREDTTLVVETLIYSVPHDALLWAGVSSTTNPPQAAAFIKSLVDAAVKEMKKQKLVK